MKRIFYAGLLFAMATIGYGEVESALTTCHEASHDHGELHGELHDHQVAGYYGFCRRCGRWGHRMCYSDAVAGVRG